MPGVAGYARWSALSQLLMFIEQGNLFNSINFNLPPETPGMAGAVPFMPAYQDPNRENMTACLTQVATFLCPSDAPPISTWPGGNNYLANQQTWACDLSENYPSTIAPNEVPRGIFYYNSSVKVAAVTDGLSNTAYFSEKIRGNGTPNPKTDLLVFANQTSLDATYQACTQLNVLTAPPLTSRQGHELGHGRDVLHSVQPRGTAKPDELRGQPIPRQHGEHGDAGASVEQSSRRSERLDGRCIRTIHQDHRRRADMAKPGHSQRRRSDLRRCLLIERRSGYSMNLNEAISLPGAHCRVAARELARRLRREPCAVYADLRRGPVFARSGLDRLA